MPAIIKASDACVSSQSTPLDLAGLTSLAGAPTDALRREAARVVAAAKHEAQRIRQEAADEGRDAARKDASRQQADQWAAVAAALRNVVEEVLAAKQAWLGHWERTAVHLAARIAERVLRRELPRHPDVPVALVREALELAAGTSQVRVELSPADYESLGPRVEAMANELGRLGSVVVTADESVSPGGCRVETSHGAIDQRFEAQLARIEEELS
jgi:flagellar assembly protein FliH